MLFSQNVSAITFEEYIIDHESDEMRAYLIGYADAVHNNAYLMGACPRKFPYRPYGEYFQHIDVYIAKKTQNLSLDLSSFYKEPIEPLLTAVIMKYTNCNNPEARHLVDEPKLVQVEIRNIARGIMAQTVQYQTPEEREKEFAYKEHVDRLDNPQKYTKQCKKCKKCPILNDSAPVILNKSIAKQESASNIHDQNIPELQETNNKENVKKTEDVPIASIQKSVLDSDTSQQPSTENTASKASDYWDNDKKSVMTSAKQHLSSEELMNPLTAMPDVNIPEKGQKKDIKEVGIIDVQAKKYELESLDVNLDNIENVTLPPL